MRLAPKADGEAVFPSLPVLSFKRAGFLDLSLQVLPPVLLPYEEKSYNPYGKKHKKGMAFSN
jgi:hypothetical protein